MTQRIFKIVILILALLITSMIYVIGLIDNTNNQIDEVQTNLELAEQELENHKKEIDDIHNEIQKIYDAISKINNNNSQSNISNTNDNTSNKQNNSVSKPNNTTHQNNTNKNTNTNYNNGIYNDIYNLYYGRLYIPNLNINVALYYGYDQYITDRNDSANIFFFGDDHGYTIADHNYQEFSKLFKITVGTQGYIQHQVRGKRDIRCVAVFNGYNNGRYIVNENGVNAMNRTDYMMYTCHYNSGKVLICLWNIV